VQAPCPSCSFKIVIDDAKVPDKPFGVKCPKCGSVARFPGKGAATPAPEAPASAPAPRPPTPSVPPPPAEREEHELPPEERPIPPLHGHRREGAPESRGEEALIAIQEGGVAGALAVVLTRLGYTVETADDDPETMLRLEQGAYAILATTRHAKAPGRQETLHQRIRRMPAQLRRELFVVLVGEDLRTGDVQQAFAVTADLVLRRRLYQTYRDAKARAEARSA
jgi:predicted Zn finger-like uncharacterized protein